MDAVILKRGVEGEGGPCTGGHGHRAAVHFVCAGNGNPIRSAGKAGLVRVHQIKIVSTCLFIAFIVERDAFDDSELFFLGVVELLQF